MTAWSCGLIMKLVADQNYVHVQKSVFPDLKYIKNLIVVCMDTVNLMLFWCLHQKEGWVEHLARKGRTKLNVKFKQENLYYLATDWRKY